MKQELITVFGATGRQGGGVVRALLARGGWRVRAVTRRPGSNATRSLAALGAEVCGADIDHPETLAAAFSGAWGAFCVTNFWEHGDALRELRQADHLAAAASAGGVGHVIWSTLEDSRGEPQPGDRAPRHGRFRVPHMDAKAQADACFIDRGLPLTRLLTSFYWENFIEMGMGPQRAADGRLELAMPLGDALLPGIAVADIGHCAATLFEREPVAQPIGIAGEHLSGAQMAHRMAAAIGEPVRWRDVPLADYAQLPFPGATELAEMFAYKQQANAALCAARSVTATRTLHPGLQRFDEWLRARAGLLAPRVAA
jgi:uncharacterized protein YbjT (DUF2867 family)